MLGELSWGKCFSGRWVRGRRNLNRYVNDLVVRYLNHGLRTKVGVSINLGEALLVERADIVTNDVEGRMAEVDEIKTAQMLPDEPILTMSVICSFTSPCRKP